MRRHDQGLLAPYKCYDCLDDNFNFIKDKSFWSKEKEEVKPCFHKLHCKTSCLQKADCSKRTTAETVKFATRNLSKLIHYKRLFLKLDNLEREHHATTSCTLSFKTSSTWNLTFLSNFVCSLAFDTRRWISCGWNMIDDVTGSHWILRSDDVSSHWILRSDVVCNNLF